MTDIVERLRDHNRHIRGRLIEGLTDLVIDDMVEAADEIERLRAALWQCVHVVQSEIEYCKDHTTAWFKLCVATREKALAALREKK